MTFSGGNSYDPNNGNALLHSFQGVTGSWIRITLNTKKTFSSFRIAGAEVLGQCATSFTLYGSNTLAGPYTAFYSVQNHAYQNNPFYEPFWNFTLQTWQYVVFQCTQIGRGNPLGQNGATLGELDFQ